MKNKVLKLKRNLRKSEHYGIMYDTNSKQNERNEVNSMSKLNQIFHFHADI